jgi:uroporphyrinogen-III decarboxylase
LPKGKVFFHFEKIDMARAKAILGGHLCIAGDVPPALLWGGSPQEVEDYCKNLIKVCGKGGGFMLISASSLDDAKPANVKAMMDSVKKYGRY